MTQMIRLGRVIGVLLVTLLATGLIVPYVMLQPVTRPPAAFLEVAAKMAPVVRLAMLQLLVGAGLSVVVSILVFSFVRERARGLALGLLALAVVNFTLQLVENSHWLTMLTVSQAHAEAGASQSEAFEVTAIAVRAAWKWAHYSHIFIAVAWLFTLFLLFFRTRAVPRALPAVGMGLCVLQFVGITLPVFAGYRMPFPMLFGMPLGFGILATSAWLMVKGIRGPSVEGARSDGSAMRAAT